LYAVWNSVTVTEFDSDGFLDRVAVLIHVEKPGTVEGFVALRQLRPHAALIDLLCTLAAFVTNKHDVDGHDLIERPELPWCQRQQAVGWSRGAHACPFNLHQIASGELWCARLGGLWVWCLVAGGQAEQDSNG
jgi:hypothetical protein